MSIEDQPTVQPVRDNSTLLSPLLLRFVTIAVIGLVMLVPLQLVRDVVVERGGLYNSVRHDVASTWGREQLLHGPLLVIPYIDKDVLTKKVKDKDGELKEVTEERFHRRHAIVLPDDLKLNVSLTDAYRHRGIYEALVYSSDTQVAGTFAIPSISALSDKVHKVHWHDAYLVMGLSDTRAINEISSLSWNDTTVDFEPGVGVSPLVRGFHAPVPDLNGVKGQHSFSFSLNFNGTAELMFAAFGASTQVEIKSTWPHPSFRGSALPATHRITDEGFSAQWSVSNLVRNYPQSWTLDLLEPDLNEFTAGVGLFEPVFLYSKTIRAVKYGILFIVLTFITFVGFELSTKVRLHHVQYALIGVALALFYLVLLSGAEHFGFFKAYVAAAALTVFMIAAYAFASLRRWDRALTVCVLLSALYALLYSLLILEDFALLMGTALLVAALAVVMYLTRNLNRTELDTTH